MTDKKKITLKENNTSAKSLSSILQSAKSASLIQSAPANTVRKLSGADVTPVHIYPPNSVDVQKLVKQTRHTFNIALWLDELAWIGKIGFYGIGILLLLLKVFRFYENIPVWVWIGFGTSIFVTSLALTYKNRYSANHSACWLDLNNAAGGQIIAACSADNTETFIFNNGKMIVPKLHLAKWFRKMLLPLIFLVAAGVLPTLTPPIAVSTAPVESVAQTLEDRLDAIFDLGVIEKPVLKEMKSHVARAKKNAVSSPESAKEALDQIQKRLEKTVLKRAAQQKESLSSSQKLSESMSKMDFEKRSEQVSKRLQKALDHLPPEKMRTNELKKILKKIDEAVGKPTGTKQQQLAQLAAGAVSILDRKTLNKLVNQAQAAHQQMQHDLGKLSGAMSSSEAKAHLKRLTKLGNTASSKQGQTQGLDTRSCLKGNCSVAAGPGAAPLTFGKEADRSKARFKPLRLKKGKQPDPGKKIGEVLADPTKKVPSEFRPSKRNVSEINSDIGGQYQGAGLSPQNRNAAELYFKEQVK